MVILGSYILKIGGFGKTDTKYYLGYFSSKEGKLGYQTPKISLGNQAEAASG